MERNSFGLGPLFRPPKPRAALMIIGIIFTNGLVHPISPRSKFCRFCRETALASREQLS
jgi:hypothetical protein